MSNDFPGCRWCRHFKGGKCKAFPNGIPMLILSGDWDHRRPFAGDNGILFEPLPSKQQDQEKPSVASWIKQRR